MKTLNKINYGTIAVNEGYAAESLERKIERMLATKEPIEDTAEMIYTERKDGVLPQFDIRTDVMEQMIESTSNLAEKMKIKREDNWANLKPGGKSEAEKSDLGGKKGDQGSPEPIADTKP